MVSRRWTCLFVCILYDGWIAPLQAWIFDVHDDNKVLQNDTKVNSKKNTLALLFSKSLFSFGMYRLPTTSGGGVGGLLYFPSELF